VQNVLALETILLLVGGEVNHRYLFMTCPLWVDLPNFVVLGCTAFGWQMRAKKFDF